MYVSKICIYEKKKNDKPETNINNRIFTKLMKI